MEIGDEDIFSGEGDQRGPRIRRMDVSKIDKDIKAVLKKSEV